MFRQLFCVALVSLLSFSGPALAWRANTPSGYAEIVINADQDKVESVIIDRMADHPYGSKDAYTLMNRQKNLLEFRGQEAWLPIYSVFSVTPTDNNQTRIILRDYAKAKKMQYRNKPRYRLQMQILESIKLKAEQQAG